MRGCWAGCLHQVHRHGVLHNTEFFPADIAQAEDRVFRVKIAAAGVEVPQADEAAWLAIVPDRQALKHFGPDFPIENRPVVVGIVKQVGQAENFHHTHEVPHGGGAGLGHRQRAHLDLFDALGFVSQLFSGEDNDFHAAAGQLVEPLGHVFDAFVHRVAHLQ